MATARKGLIATAMVASLLTAAPALADSSGVPGKAIGIEHNDDASDDYGIHHGALFVDEGEDTPRMYRWGGSLCLGRELDIDQQRMLLDAMRSKMILLPYYKLGNGGTRCLTSFAFTPKKQAVVDIAK